MRYKVTGPTSNQARNRDTCIFLAGDLKKAKAGWLSMGWSRVGLSFFCVVLVFRFFTSIPLANYSVRPLPSPTPPPAAEELHRQAGKNGISQ